MRNLLLILATALSVFALMFSPGCTNNDSTSGYGSPAPMPANPNTVLMTQMTFSPQTLNVAVGTTVTWDNRDSFTHTSTADDASWNSGDVGAGGQTTHKFTAVGTYTYHCKYHQSMGMVGTITVK